MYVSAYQDGDGLFDGESTEGFLVPHHQELPHLDAGLQLGALVSRLHVCQQLVCPRGCVCVCVCACVSVEGEGCVELW